LDGAPVSFTNSGVTPINPSTFTPSPVYNYSFSIPNTGYSSVMFLISDFAPVLATAGLAGDNGGPANGFGVPVPTAAPEPATMAMMAIGLPLAGIGYIRRKRQAKAETVA